MVEKLTSTPTRKKSKGLIIGKIKSTTPKMVAKIVSIDLTVTGRGCDLRIDMLEGVERIADSGKTCHWDQYVANMIKKNCVKF